MNAALNGIGMTSQRTRTRMIERLREQGIRDERVLTAMAAVPRHIFVGEALAHRAYEDTALPLILGQTISQPFVVARMTELLLAGRDSLGKTLEIGAGCGYQAAVLAMLTKQVYSIERLAPLLAQARENLRQCTGHVRLKHADGMLGLPEAAPFDTIVVVAAAGRRSPFWTAGAGRAVDDSVGRCRPVLCSGARAAGTPKHASTGCAKIFGAGAA
jgi:protein-L-isoaspartate(D-aspartate) O-methyltransferase